MILNDYGDTFEWGLKEDQIVHVDDVENGLASNCICPACGAPLIAFNRQGNKRANHFQHKSKASCNTAYETALHYIAKQVILETKTLAVPDISFHLSSYAGFYGTWDISERMTGSKLLRFDKVEVEKGEQDFRPDLKCYIGGKTVLIEIAVTHFVDADKKAKIVQRNIPTLEIDLSAFSRDTQKIKLLETLHGNIEKMTWIYNPRIKERKNVAESKGRKVKDYLGKNLQTRKVYGKEHHIYDCPIYKRDYGKIRVEDECHRCRYFIGEYEGAYATGDEQPKFPSTTLDCIGHKGWEFDNLLKSLGIKVKD